MVQKLREPKEVSDGEIACVLSAAGALFVEVDEPDNVLDFQEVVDLKDGADFVH